VHIPKGSGASLADRQQNLNNWFQNALACVSLDSVLCWSTC
jgi:hypothetical protein